MARRRRHPPLVGKPAAKVLGAVAGGVGAAWLLAGRSSSPPPGPPPPAGWLDTFVLVVLENHPYSAIIGNTAQAPYLNSLARAGASSANYHAVAHPSLVNYLALTCGSITDPLTGHQAIDQTPCGTLNRRSIADNLEEAGLDWREYVEDLPAGFQSAATGACVQFSGQYALDHDPFAHYAAIFTAPARRARILPYSAFNPAAGLAPYTLLIPNRVNDMHSSSALGPIPQGDLWCSQQLPRVLNSPAFAPGRRALLAVTWDEDDDLAAGQTPANQVACIFAGPLARRGLVSSSHATHYSLLRTVEDGFGLAALADEAQAAPMFDMIAA